MERTKVRSLDEEKFKRCPVCARINYNCTRCHALLYCEVCERCVRCGPLADVMAYEPVADEAYMNLEERRLKN